jgi:hypothetical protein
MMIRSGGSSLTSRLLLGSRGAFPFGHLGLGPGTSAAQSIEPDGVPI